MTDLEITKRCAEAMEITHSWTDRKVYFGTGAWNLETSITYQPLNDDAQAMALVKKFRINIAWYEVNVPSPGFEPTVYMWLKTDLNRAICECVAKMKEAS